MRELILAMSLSLDGFVAGPRGKIDWVFQGDEQAKAWKVATIADASLHLMGSRTFTAMAGFWPTASGPFAAPMNDIPKAVISQRCPELLPQDDTRWSTAYLARGPLAGEIAALKRDHGRPIVAHGGATLARSLVALGLIDRYALMIHPVILGSGLSIFTDVATPTHLERIDTQSFPSGAVAQTYRPR